MSSSILTGREVEILQYVMRGYIDKQTACELGLSTQTVKNCVHLIMIKLQAKTRTEAVVTAIRQGALAL